MRKVLIIDCVVIGRPSSVSYSGMTYAPIVADECTLACAEPLLIIQEYHTEAVLVFPYVTLTTHGDLSFAGVDHIALAVSDSPI
jgi:hypothetical protein